MTSDPKPTAAQQTPPQSISEKDEQNTGRVATEK